MSRLDDLNQALEGTGYHVVTYSPGDGVTRYRFTETSNGYFGPGNGIFTALGIKEAETYAAGFLQERTK